MAKKTTTTHIILMSVGFIVAASLGFWFLNGSIDWWHIGLIACSLLLTDVALIYSNKAPRASRANSSKSTH